MKILDVFNAVKTLRTEGNDKKIDAVYALFDRTRPENRSAEQLLVETRMKSLMSKLDKKWEHCNRTESRFLRNHAEWLNRDVVFFTDESEQAPSGVKAGRSLVPYEISSERTKSRRTAALRSQATTEELVDAAVSSLHADGHRAGAKLMAEIFCGDPAKIDEAKSAIDATKEGRSSVIPVTPEKAVSYMVQCGLTKEQYLKTRKMAVEQNAERLLPSYHIVSNAKNECYPPSESITVTEGLAGVSLKGLMDHTTSRLCTVQEPMLNSLTADQVKNLVLVSKWGLDGSGGHSRYKQQSSESALNDSNLLATSVVPLQLYAKADDGNKIIVWQNPRPSSPRYCRPLRLQFIKETTDVTNEEVSRVKAEIGHLNPSVLQVSDREVRVVHDLRLTMVDGKVCNAIVGNRNSQACYICGAKAAEMNNLDKVMSKPVNNEALQLGLSTLHAWIRTFEYLLHVSYRTGIKKWQCRTPGEKKKLEDKKEQVQREFKNQTGLIIDVVKQGFGTSNDGNTARRFFENPTVTSQITGLDRDLLERFQILLCTLASAYEVNIVEYERYALDTARKCLQLYPWYNMPPTVHKILLHGAAIMREAPLPIGMFAEDAQESRHKDCKKFRVSHTRKISRVACNTDLLHTCLVTSDPLITSLRKLPLKKQSQLSTAVLALLTEPNLSVGDLPPEYEDTSDEDLQ